MSDDQFQRAIRDFMGDETPENVQQQAAENVCQYLAATRGTGRYCDQRDSRLLVCYKAAEREEELSGGVREMHDACKQRVRGVLDQHFQTGDIGFAEDAGLWVLVARCDDEHVLEKVRDALWLRL